MATVLKDVWKPTGKHIINFVLFLASALIVTLIMPGTTGKYSGFSGKLIIATSCYVVLFLFIAQFRSDVLEVTRKTLFIILTILFFALFTALSMHYGSRAYCIIPFALIPVIIHTFFDARLALLVLLVSLMISGFFVPGPFEFFFMNFISGMVAIFVMSDTYRKGKIFFAALGALASTIVLHTGFILAEQGSFAGTGPEYMLLIYNSLLVLLSYPVIFLFEKKFYFLSNTTLLELSDTNHPLLRKFAGEAPGSFQHSRQVAVLAEEAAREIGANLLLARAGALYHDIGKIVNSGYFIENQSASVSPHENLDPLSSSRLIISHVSKGVDLARKYKLPVQIIDFIRTHHGTTKAYFFYKKYLMESGGQASTVKSFEYSGPKPFSRELAIVMMADAVEASSRSLDKYSEDSIDQLVERIILLQEEDDQYSDSPLTFKDISDIKRVFKKSLATVYHSRIAYPERN